MRKAMSSNSPVRFQLRRASKGGFRHFDDGVALGGEAPILLPP